MRVDIDSKYSIDIDEDYHNIHLLRYGQLWETEPHYSKIFIAIAYEIQNLRDQLRLKEKEQLKKEIRDDCHSDRECMDDPKCRFHST